MASILRYFALAMMLSAVHGYVLAQMPSPTIGIGSPVFDLMPTNAPSLELVKKNLDKKFVTNTCSEWTISVGLGYTPICGNSETCLFTSATDGNLYEGCGQTSIAYNWITACYDYNVQPGLPPVSQTYCPSAAPYCGSFVFILDDLNTFYNFGCSSYAYSSTAYFIESVSSTDLQGGGTTKITQAPTVTVTKAPDTTAPPQNGASSTTADSNGGSTSLPTINSHTKKKAPIGAIVGGVIGGIAVVILAAFLAWFCLRKRKQDKVASQTNEMQTQQQQADAATAAAFHSPNRIPEMGGDPKPPTVFPPSAGYMQQGYTGQVAYNAEKPMVNPNTQELYNPGAPSPPPVYGQPPSSPPISNYPPSNYTELDNSVRQSPPPPISPLGAHTNVTSPSMSELGGTNRASYQAYNPPMPEMSAVAPVVQRPARQSGVDMSGAPMSESYQPHEMP